MRKGSKSIHLKRNTRGIGKEAVKNADIILIDIETKRPYTKTEEIKARMLSSDIKDLTESFFIDYVNEKYGSHPNYEMIFWDFIKNSQNPKIYQKYEKIFPDGTFAGLAKLKIRRLSNDKRKKLRGISNFLVNLNNSD